jgi:hypothetical protein
MPPKQMQDDQIWTLVIANIRDNKVPEYYYTKRKMPLLTYQAAVERYNRMPQKYAPAIGIVSSDYIVLDIDKTTWPEEIQNLLKDHPTLHHKSKSGNGFRVVYSTETPLPKKMMAFEHGEVYCGAFVTMNPPLQDEQQDYSTDTITSIEPQVLANYSPKIKKRLNNIAPEHSALTHISNYPDGEKLFQEARQILSILPADVTPLLETTYELRLKDFELTSYSHWLLVSHALADLCVGVARDYDLGPQLKQLFIEWSRQSQSFISDEDVEERWSRSLHETITANKPIVTFSTLRKLYWGYRIPIEEFPKIKVDKKGNTTIDTSDPRNFEFLTRRLKLTLVRDFYTGLVYIKGPKAIIRHYFTSGQGDFLTKENENISIPFLEKYRNDEDLQFRLVNLFRDFGISGAAKTQPIFAGFYQQGEELIDAMYLWLTSKPWDKTPRFMDTIKASIQFDPTVLQDLRDHERMYTLIWKHCLNMVGLRAKANRYLTGSELPEDRLKRAQGILILAGYQSTHKTTWVECLLPSKADAVNSVTPSSMRDTLEMQRALAGAFILNIDEVDAVLDKIDLSDFKNVLTQEKDTYRTMYTQQFRSLPRAAGFFGTTNKSHMRLDRTGNRRFWIVPVKSCDALPFLECDYQQLWAEALYYAENTPIDEWNMSSDDKDFINRIAMEYQKENQGTKSLDMIYSDSLYTHEDIDFKFFFEDLKTVAVRFFAKEDVLIPLRGQKAFQIIKNRGLLAGTEFDLKSFDYIIKDFIADTTGLHNQVVSGRSGSFFKDGVFTYTPGDRRYKYYFLPDREKINEAIAQGLVSPYVFYEEREKKIDEAVAQGLVSPDVFYEELEKKG